MGDVPAAAAAASPARRRRRGGDDGFNRVAEIVMVLAAAGEIRGGREPTAAERALMAMARERLAAAVADGSVRPKDLFPGEAVRAVVEDLGLNRARDPAAMGFRPPKASIADRLMLTKRKMEEVKEAPTQPPSTPQTAVSSGMSEFHGLHGASKFGVGAPRNPQATAPLNSSSLVTLKPPGPAPVKSVNNSAVALPHTGQPHLKLDKDVNGPLNLARNGANIVHSTKSTPDSAGPSVNTAQSSNQVVKNQDTKTVVQAATGNPVTGLRATPGAAYVPPKNPFIHHNAIAKSVQEFLHQPTNHPSWTPPSTEYMHSRLLCQICKVVISDVDSVLICDACERGAHLVCLQNYGNKGVPKAEWHCSICLTQSKGKPLPPKYGKVTRTAVASKAAPVSGAQFSLQGSAETKATMEIHHKMAANGNSMKLVSTKAASTIPNSNVLALTAPTTGSQSQLVSTLRPSIGNAIKSEALYNEKEGSGQLCSSTAQNSTSSPPNKRLRSESSLNSVESANDMAHVKKTEGVSMVNCADSSFSVGAKTFNPEGQSEPVSSRDEEIVDRSKSEGHSEPFTSRDEEIVDHSGTQMKQTRTTAAEQRPMTQTPFELEKMQNFATATKTGTATTDQDTKFATEEKHQSQGTSEPDSISDMEVTIPAGKPLCQSSSVAIEENLTADAASEPPIDQRNNPAIVEKPSEQTSAVNDGEIPACLSEHANGLNRNGLKESPCGGKNASGSDASSNHGSIQTFVPNGVLHPKDEILYVSENEAVGVSAETKVQAK